MKYYISIFDQDLLSFEQFFYLFEKDQASCPVLGFRTYLIRLLVLTDLQKVALIGEICWLWGILAPSITPMRKLPASCKTKKVAHQISQWLPACRILSIFYLVRNPVSALWKVLASRSFCFPFVLFISVTFFEEFFPPDVLEVLNLFSALGSHSGSIIIMSHSLVPMFELKYTGGGEYCVKLLGYLSLRHYYVLQRF